MFSTRISHFFADRKLRFDVNSGRMSKPQKFSPLQKSSLVILGLDAIAVVIQASLEYPLSSVPDIWIACSGVTWTLQGETEKKSMLDTKLF